MVPGGGNMGLQMNFFILLLLLLHTSNILVQRHLWTMGLVLIMHSCPNVPMINSDCRMAEYVRQETLSTALGTIRDKLVAGQNTDYTGSF